MFDAGSIASSLGLDLSEFSAGFIQAESIMRIFPAQVTTFLANPLLGLIDIAKSAASAVKGAVLEIANAADNAGEAAERAGVTVEWLTRLQPVAADAGASAEELGNSLKFLNKATGEAFAGNKTALASFENLGISILDAGGNLKSTQTLFMDVANAIAALPSPAQKTAAAMDLLGRSGEGMLSFLNLGSAGMEEMAALSDRLGATIGGNLAKSGDSFARLQKIVEMAWSGIKQQVAEPILQFVAEHYNEIVDAIVAGSDFIRSAIDTVGPVVKGLWDMFAGLAEIVGSVLTPVFKALRPVLEVIAKVLSTIFEIIGKVLSGIGQAIRGVTDFFGITEEAQAGGGAGGKGKGGTTVNVAKVEVAPFDSREASSELAKKIHAPLREKTDKEKKRVEAHAAQEFVLMAL